MSSPSTIDRTRILGRTTNPNRKNRGTIVLPCIGLASYLTSCRGRWWFSVEYNGDKWFTYVDFFDEELEGGYEFAVKQLQTRFEERARLAMQLTAANIYDQAPWIVGDDLLALSDDASDDDVEWIKANCLRDAGELDRWQDLFLSQLLGIRKSTPWSSAPTNTKRRAISLMSRRRCLARGCSKAFELSRLTSTSWRATYTRFCSGQIGVHISLG
mmetsp:Transcript_8333/g.13099  ORF Transcript_8333/g.13099 Transcript_8333/m.13099 type:complete len:214 (-) Transcript_8333:439-1080(-)